MLMFNKQLLYFMFYFIFFYLYFNFEMRDKVHETILIEKCQKRYFGSQITKLNSFICKFMFIYNVVEKFDIRVI